MDVINIAVGKEDRWRKMLEIRTHIEFKDPYVITSISNMAEVAEALGRPVSYTVRHFGFEMMASTRRGDKNGTFEIDGAHSAAQLARAANKFIKTYVECYSCGHPETELIINEKYRAVNLVCGDCGSISEVDRRQGLSSFMIRNHFLEAKKGIKCSQVKI